MEYIINIRAQGSKLNAFLNFIESLDFVEIFEVKKQNTETITSEKAVIKEQKAFKKKLFDAMQEAEDVRAGKKEAIPFESCINEFRENEVNKPKEKK